MLISYQYLNGFSSEKGIFAISFEFITNKASVSHVCYVCIAMIKEHNWSNNMHQSEFFLKNMFDSV